MPKTLRTTLTAAGVAALAAGCAGQPVVHSAHLDDAYQTEMLTYAAKQGGMLTEIVGTPFGAERAAVARRVTEAFEAAHFGPELDFFTEAPSDYRSPYKVVVLFDPAPGVGAPGLCAGDARPQVEAGGTVRVLAVFCSAEQRVNSAYGSLAGATGLDDPSFGALMQQLGLQLFPAQEPLRRKDSEWEISQAPVASPS